MQSTVTALKKQLSGDVVDDDEEDSEVLPELSSAECERLGWRLGEANVLDGEWNAVRAREYQHACRQKFVTLGFNKLSKGDPDKAVEEYNRQLRDSEQKKTPSPP